MQDFIIPEYWFCKHPFRGKWSCTKWTGGVCDLTDIPFIRVKGQIGIEVSGEIKCGHQGNAMNTGDDKGHSGKRWHIY